LLVEVLCASRLQSHLARDLYFFLSLFEQRIKADKEQSVRPLSEVQRVGPDLAANLLRAETRDGDGLFQAEHIGVLTAFIAPDIHCRAALADANDALSFDDHFCSSDLLHAFSSLQFLLPRSPPSITMSAVTERLCS